MLMLWSPFFNSLIWRKTKNNNVNMALSKARVKVVHPVSDRALTNLYQITCTERTTYTYTWTMFNNATHGLGDQVVGSWVNKPDDLCTSAIAAKYVRIVLGAFPSLQRGSQKRLTTQGEAGRNRRLPSLRF